MEAATERAKAAETALAQATDELDEAIDEVCTAITELEPDPAQRTHDPKVISVLQHLYWTHTVIRSDLLARAAGFTHINPMLEAIGPTSSGVACTHCGRDIPRTSRSWKLPADGVCRICAQARSQASQLRSRTGRFRSAYATGGFAPAPITDWLVAVRIVLAHPPLSTKVEPGSLYDYHTGVWRNYDSALYVQAQLSTKDALPGSAKMCLVRQEPARILVDTAMSIAASDSERMCEVTADLTDEAPTYVLSRLHDQLDQFRAQREEEALVRFPDGYQPKSGEAQWPEDEDWRKQVRVMQDPYTSRL